MYVDAYTDVWNVYTIKTKYQVHAVEKRYLADMASYGGLGIIKHIHSDNGGEFKSDLQQLFFQNEEIARTYSVPYTPQQNSWA